MQRLPGSGPELRHRGPVSGAPRCRARRAASCSRSSAISRRFPRSTTTRPARSPASLGRDGSVVGEFATERRVIVSYEDIPPRSCARPSSRPRTAFSGHSGLSVRRMLLASVPGTSCRRAPGPAPSPSSSRASCFPTSSSTPERKIKETLVALQIEKRYTKDEIFTMYCNKVAWGHGVYGVEAASQLYFAKSAKELTLNEAATIAGMHPAHRSDRTRTRT